MPKLNGTGPQGLGPRTGRGMGWCPSGYGFGLWGRGLARGWGRRFGFGRFWRPFAGSASKEEKEMLNEELKYLRETVKEIEKRLEELNKK